MKKVVPLLLNGIYPDGGSDWFNNCVEDTLHFLRDEEELAGDNIILPPFRGELPEVWALSISNRGLSQALNLGLNYSRSIFHQFANINHEKEKLAEFREQFRHRHHREAAVNLAFAGYCSATSQRAEKEFELLKQTNVQLATLNTGSPDFVNCVVGCPNKFLDTLAAYREDYGVDEFIFFDLADRSEVRFRSLELLADVFRLGEETATITNTRDSYVQAI